MNKIRTLIGVGLLTCLGTANADFVEVSDAGSLIGSAQMVDAGTTHITGRTGFFDREDMFGFNWAGGAFSAATNGALGSARNFDTMLFLFDSLGGLITANDDAGNLGSRIFANLTAGTYYLGISGWSNDARNAAGGDLRFGATGPLHHWQGFGDYGRYRIGLNGATSGPTTAVPEPGTLALLGLGLAGLGLSRRKKIA